jgi:hypothetical protein
MNNNGSWVFYLKIQKNGKAVPAGCILPLYLFKIPGHRKREAIGEG